MSATYTCLRAHMPCVRLRVPSVVQLVLAVALLCLPAMSPTALAQESGVSVNPSGDESGGETVASTAALNSDAGEPGLMVDPDHKNLPWYQGVTEAQRMRALALLEQAATLTEELRFIDALARYQQALAEWDHPEIHFEMARAALRVNQPVLAWEHLDKVWRWGPNALIGEDREQARQLELMLLQEHLAVVELRSGQSGISVTLAGKQFLVGPGVTRHVVRPGMHTVAAAKAGHYPLLQSISLAAGRQATMTVALSEDRVVETRRWSRWKPWAVVGTGVALGLAGAGLRWDADRTLSDAEAQFADGCGDDLSCAPVADAGAKDKASARYTIGTSAVIAGGAVAVTGLTMVVLNMSRSSRSEDRSRALVNIGPTSVTRVLPVVSGDSAGVMVFVDF